MLLTRFPRVVSAQIAVAPPGRETTARWLPSMTPSPLNEPTMESNGRSETVPVEKERPPSDDDASTTSALMSRGSRLRS